MSVNNETFATSSEIELLTPHRTAHKIQRTHHNILSNKMLVFVRESQFKTYLTEPSNRKSPCVLVTALAVVTHIV